VAPAAGVLDSQGPIASLRADRVVEVITGPAWIIANLDSNMMPMPVQMNARRLPPKPSGCIGWKHRRLTPKRTLRPTRRS